ncbi:TonB-linked SusC/RagA family outer membrane protein [Mucilaginibacter yixingensis]|uniref:TonB-linked SusC/RagA family outer membrane protein n=1 Tax=Mucilaginibacter yixingensis TaxID=1295612 RepID=A0A2T5JH21_9SPHI|nr:SusC/RagA family TonB-linked outer membrane protein [Mucilaginibacter yixingensis]PTR01666.1 TonB-linked SusC/RagA family outer membrane protein [Mucilaginibacter yixingensis]
MRVLFTRFLLLGVVAVTAVHVNTVKAQTAPAAAQATTVTIRGKVIDKKDKQSLIGATVVEIDKDKRTVGGVATDLNGNFALKLKNPKNKISFSLIGYKTQVVDVLNRTTINIELEQTSNTLSDVVVTANKTTSNGLLTIDRRNSTTAVATLNAKDIEEMSSATIDQALQGRLPGVDIAANSGDPGAGMQIRIRGTSTINGSTNPLIVLDGMPYETEVPSDFNFGTADEQGYAALLNIAPADIADISVLKDAAATAVWGSRAANGVLVINTKRGKVGAPQVTYTLRVTGSKQPDAIPMLTGNQYSQLIPEEVMNRTGTPLNTQTVKEFLYDPSDRYYYYNYSNNTNWVDAITRTGVTHDHNLSLSGGGEKARYFASVSYLNQTGTTMGTALGRITTRINLDYDVSNRIKFRTDISYAHSNTDKAYEDDARSIAYQKMPNMSIYEFNTNGINTGNYLSPVSNIQGTYPGTFNPVAMLAAGKNNAISERIVPHFNLQYDIVPSLFRATFDIQFDINNLKNKTFLPQIATGQPISNTNVNNAFDGDADQFSIETKTNFIFTPHLGENHEFIGLLSFMSNDNKSTTLQEQSSNSASVQLQDPSIDSRVQGLSSSFSQTRSVAALINGQYSFMDRYIINAGLRLDGNSKFGPDKRWGLFPSISGRWRISGEKFMKGVDFISDLSLRGSYGQSGNDPKNNYSFYNQYGNYAWDYLGSPAVYSQNIQLNNLRYETVTGQDVGLTFALWKNRINVDVDLYRNRTTDLFFNGLQLPSISGFSTINMNVGTMDNQGWEINLNATAIKTKDYAIDFNFNIANNTNIIRQISPFYPSTQGDITTNGQYKTLLQINNPFGSFYGFKYQGVYKDQAATVATDANGKPIVGLDGVPLQMRFNYPANNYVFKPGDAKYADINHDGNIDYKDVVYLGNGNPKFTGGFGPTVTYKGALKLTFFFSYRFGYQIVNGTRMVTSNMYGFNNQSTEVLQRWRNPGDITNVPRALWNDGYNWLGSDRYVEDGSFIRLRSITARYTFTKRMVAKLGIKSASAYITAENLFTFTKYTGQDPEVSVRGSDPFRVATDNSMTPPTRNLALGLVIGF